MKISFKRSYNIGRTKFHKAGIYLLFYLVMASIFFLTGCSSSSETEKKEEKIRYEEKREKVIKNLDALEREYINSSKINSIEKINLVINSDGALLSSEKLSTLNYNPEGFLTETIIYDDEGSVKFKFIYDYNKGGERTKTSRYIDGNLANYYYYEYNQYGNKEKALRYNTNEELEEYYIYEYDDEGNLIGEEWFSADGEKIYSIENDYDSGRKSRSYTYDENGELIFEYVFKYDEKGNIIEEIKYDDSGLQAGVIQYIYKYF